MGVDYIGEKPQSDKGESLHLNPWGHSNLQCLLAQLGCDLSQWDNPKIGQRVCESWARAIRNALANKRVFKATWPDATAAEGKADMLLVWEVLPVLHKLREGNALAIEVAVEMLDDNPEDRKWLEAIAAFFADAGGCCFG